MKYFRNKNDEKTKETSNEHIDTIALTHTMTNIAYFLCNA